MIKVQLVDINKVIPYDSNPRKNDEAVEEVAKSIQTFGFKNPIIVDKDFIIIAGHTRLKASQKLGLKEVPVIVAEDLTPDQANALRLADNKTSELAKWDKKLLDEELRKIDWEALNIQMTDLGFNDIFASDFQEVIDDEFDEGQYLTDEPYSIQGDVYLLENHRVMCGDSTDPEQVKVLMNERQADMVFTDPPYNVNYEGSDGQSIQNDDMGDKEFYDFLFLVHKNLYDSLKDGGPIYVCHADSEGLNFRQAFKDAGFKLAECLIWSKNSFTLGRQDYQWQHEPILYGWKPTGPHYFLDDRSQSTIWEYDKPKHNDLHPTMKPLELVGKAINNSSLKGELVLDLFGGSGSTLIASDQANRICYTMELDEKYADVIIKRYLKLKGNTRDCFLLRNGEKIPLTDIDEFVSVINEN